MEKLDEPMREMKPLLMKWNRVEKQRLWIAEFSKMQEIR